MLLKLKNFLYEIHLLSTPDLKHGKVFEKVPIVEFTRAKSLKKIIVRVKAIPLEKKEAVADHMEVLDTKYGNML